MLLAFVLPVALPAYAGPGESDSVARVQSARSSQGRPSYAVRADLTSVARRHAARMAARGEIYHNDNLGSEVSGWRSVGENVGRGTDTAEIHQAFMASSSHRSNILSRTYTEIGVGTAVAGNGELFLVQVFRLPDGSSSSSRASAAPAPRPPAPAASEPARRTTRTTRTTRATRSAPRRPIAGAPRPDSRASALSRSANPRILLGRRLGRISALAAARPTGGVFDDVARFDWTMRSLVR